MTQCRGTNLSGSTEIMDSSVVVMLQVRVIGRAVGNFSGRLDLDAVVSESRLVSSALLHVACCRGRVASQLAECLVGMTAGTSADRHALGQVLFLRMLGKRTVASCWCCSNPRFLLCRCLARWRS